MEMDDKQFTILEVKPKESGWYLVTLFQFKKMESGHPDYIKDWLEFDGKHWDYFGYKDNCYVCFIHQRDEELKMR